MRRALVAWNRSQRARQPRANSSERPSARTSQGGSGFTVTSTFHPCQEMGTSRARIKGKEGKVRTSEGGTAHSVIKIF